MLNPDSSLEHMRKNIEMAIDQTLDAEKEKLILSAVREFEAAVRKRVGEITLSLSNIYSVNRFGSDLVIHVRIEESKSQEVTKNE